MDALTKIIHLSQNLILYIFSLIKSYGPGMNGSLGVILEFDARVSHPPHNL